MAGLFKLFVIQSQDAWGVRNRLRTVCRQTQADGINQASVRVFGHGGFIMIAPQTTSLTRRKIHDQRDSDYRQTSPLFRDCSSIRAGLAHPDPDRRLEVLEGYHVISTRAHGFRRPRRKWRIGRRYEDADEWQEH